MTSDIFRVYILMIHSSYHIIHVLDVYGLTFVHEVGYTLFLLNRFTILAKVISRLAKLSACLLVTEYNKIMNLYANARLRTELVITTLQLGLFSEFLTPLICVRQFYDDFNARFAFIYNVAMSRSCTEASYINKPGKSSCESSWNWTANFANRYCVLNFPQTDLNYSFAAEGNRKTSSAPVNIILFRNPPTHEDIFFLLFLLRYYFTSF